MGTNIKAVVNRSQILGENHIDRGTEVIVVKKAKNISEIEYKEKKHFIYTEYLTWNG